MRIEPETYLSRRRLSVLVPMLAAMLALASCGGGSGRETRVPGHTLTIYSSLPRHGVGARVGAAFAAGEQLALADAHGHVGSRRVRLVDLDDSDPGGPIWSPSVVEENARRAVADPTTIAYIGELDLGGSAVSVPVTNDSNVLQVSPGDGLTSLTRSDPGGSTASGPERYYPSDRRTFLRLVPTDRLQAQTLVAWALQQGATRLAVVQDERLFSHELAAEAVVAAARAHLAVVGVADAKDDPTSYPGLAVAVAQMKPDAVLYTGVGAPATGGLLDAIRAALPHAHLYASSALATASPPPAELAASVDVVKPALPASRYPPDGRRVLARLGAELGAPVAAEALYGYEAMEVVLDAIRRAGRAGNDRVAVARMALVPRTRRSVLGTYSLTAGGDTSTTDFGAYTLSGGGLAFQGVRGP